MFTKSENETAKSARENKSVKTKQCCCRDENPRLLGESSLSSDHPAGDRLGNISPSAKKI